MCIELLGIAATVFVLISFLMKDAARIRAINIVGAFLFVIYGLLINSISVWLLNAVLMIVHIKFLKGVRGNPPTKKTKEKNNERKDQKCDGF